MKAAYVRGRLISENISLVQEMVHSMKRQSGRVGSLALKMDMSKAFDRLECDFLMQVLKQFGFCDKWCHLIHQCISTTQVEVLLNGSPCQYFHPSRGIRQGDPFSPYLFIIDMESLSRRLAFCEQTKIIPGVKIARRAPKINHLLFANVCLLFSKENLDQTRKLLEVIEEFNKFSGQVINFNKSSLYFSNNVRPSACETLAGILQVSIMDSSEKYLRLPFFIGRDKKIPFYSLVEKIDTRLSMRNSTNLSEPGRTIMIKHVLNALPVHHMTSFKLPDQTVKKLNSIPGKFWRRKDTNKGAIISWSNLSRYKEEGGLGFRDLECFNKALLSKSAWRLCTRGFDLWFDAMGAKYYPNGDIFEYTVKDDSSYAWRSISSQIQFIKENNFWNLGNGSLIRIWKDVWIPGLDSPPEPKTNSRKMYGYLVLTLLLNLKQILLILLLFLG
ncbi:uncharacterized protein LOC113352635 [Papaver somniferum]|uniref:uncharacterized protein LOC113352635 n=1 Tax=Papaver somniferum TaxID=3469 RepID=UPI000E702EFD|nr:uncharacterized protein LOC113352635 [Papaver somniferum]